jgi:2-iminobutanoate/2-iminopropanoate deaminase
MKDGDNHMPEKQIISTPHAPQAIGPYSIGVKVGDMLYCAGQIGLDPQSGDIVPGGIEAETRRALLNLQGILEEAGGSLDNVVKTTVFLRDINDFGRMNSVYSEFFTEKYPARSAVQVAALPRGVAVEIEAIAVIGSE